MTGPQDPHLSVVIPAYNEERRIGTTLDKVAAFLREKMPRSEIVVVDDGSKDGTAALARAFPTLGIPLRVLGDGVNRGKGYAVRVGMLAARGACILMSDADLSTPIEEVTLLLSPVMRGEYDIAIGSRGLPSSRLGKRQPWARERMGRIFNVAVRAVTGLRISDTQCGFKLFTREAAHHLFGLARGTGFAFDAEILFVAERAGYRVLEEPVTWNNALGSKVNPILDSMRMLRDLIRVRVHHLRGAYDLGRHDTPARRGIPEPYQPWQSRS